MEKIDWKVEGMDCSNCALSISKFLQKKGMQEVNVNPIDGKVTFIDKENSDLEKIKIGIWNSGGKESGVEWLRGQPKEDSGGGTAR